MRAPSTPPSERLDTPYADITAADLMENVGRVTAVDRRGRGIIETADTVDDLRALMALVHPDNQDYRTLPIADLSGVVHKAD